jgi:hypothetical protein
MMKQFTNTCGKLYKESSKLCVYAILFMIVLFGAANMVVGWHLTSLIASGNLNADSLDALKSIKPELPLDGLISMAMLVIPIIYGRKAAREISANWSEAKKANSKTQIGASDQEPLNSPL